jgi:HK97 family phage portal protein
VDAELLAQVQKHVPVLHRAAEVPQVDPRTHTPNAATATGSVGPQSTGGAVLGADDWAAVYGRPWWHPEAWDGWPDGWGTPWGEPPDGRQWSGEGAGRQLEDHLARVGQVMTCIDLNSSQLASFPVYGVRGVEPVELPSWSSNPEPLNYTDWSDWMQATVNALCGHGECFVYATGFFADGYPARFVTLAPGVAHAEPDPAGGVRLMIGDTIVPRTDMLHIRYQTFAGRASGVGPLEWAYRAAIGADVLDSYATNLARYGVWAVLRHPANLNARQRDDLKANWITARLNNPAAPAVLSGGVEFDTVSLSPREMALLELATADKQAICAAFRVPPYLVGIDQPGSMTYANASTLTDHHWRVGLRPLAKRVATALSSWLLPRGTRLEFDRDEYIRPDLGDRANAYSVLHALVDDDGARALTVPEIRAAERFPSLPGTSPDDAAADSGIRGASNP